MIGQSGFIQEPLTDEQKAQLARERGLNGIRNMHTPQYWWMQAGVSEVPDYKSQADGHAEVAETEQEIQETLDKEFDGILPKPEDAEFTFFAPVVVCVPEISDTKLEAVAALLRAEKYVLVLYDADDISEGLEGFEKIGMLAAAQAVATEQEVELRG